MPRGLRSMTTWSMYAMMDIRMQMDAPGVAYNVGPMVGLTHPRVVVSTSPQVFFFFRITKITKIHFKRFIFLNKSELRRVPEKEQ